MVAGGEPRRITDRERPQFPARAVITGGMPYGNKDLHFGHIGGVFIPADCLARFLRDRLGDENVIFVSGTDCYGSPIVEYHRNAVEAGEFEGTLQALVEFNHQRQKATLADYSIELNLFAASSIEPFVSVHTELGASILKTLHNNGHLTRRTTPQFYDAQRETFLNGRQVVGRCPVQGCQSERGYADECSLGHQYEPAELIAPKSTLSGVTPEMRDVTNWYLDLPRFRDAMSSFVQAQRSQPGCRQFAVSTMMEFFEPPSVHITNKQLEQVDEIAHLFPEHERQSGRGKSTQFVFASLEDKDRTLEILAKHQIRYRTGKTLVPFRLTGNLDWGLNAPTIDGLSELTFWVWPESLWAPISFSSSYLQSKGHGPDEWRRWWCSKEAAVYQIIGEDNIFFYGVAQSGIWLGMQGPEYLAPAPEGEWQLTELVANRHVMFLDKKASSSGKVKPPMAREILDYYTSDQLRAHFISMGLGLRGAGFKPGPLNPAAKPNDPDPVLKEAKLLGTFNRSVRSCFYTLQKFYDGKLPAGQVSDEVIELAETAILDYEQAMFKREFHRALKALGDFIRQFNPRWNATKPYKDETDPAVRAQGLLDAFHFVRVAAVLLHPIAPDGSERIREYLNLDTAFWSWESIFEPLSHFIPEPQKHSFKFLEPRVDFFEIHPSQVR